MTPLFPEQPILLYPSLAERFGVEAALLLSIYHQFGLHHGAEDSEGRLQFVIRRREWLELAPFWGEEQLAQLTNNLVEQQVIEAQFLANGSIQLHFNQMPSNVKPSSPAKMPKPLLKPLSQEQETAFEPAPLPASIEHSHHNSASSPLVRGPAPSFGGSTGWVKPKDDLQRLFEQQEQKNQQLKQIDKDWQPQPATLEMLAKRNISEAFVRGCIDQFVAYYIGEGKRKRSWEQPFMKWVAREWNEAQQIQQRQQLGNQQSYSSERDQRTARQQRRKQITDSIMDINNIDW